MEISGIILSGGKSSRMGSEKGMVLFKGKPLIEYAIEALKPNCTDLIISTNNPDYYSKYKLTLIEDQYKNRGPIGGIYSCLKKSKTQLNIVLSCDMPFVNSEMINYLIQHIKTDINSLVPVHDREKMEPLCAFYNANIINAIELFIKRGDYKLMNLLKSINAQKLEIEKWNKYRVNSFRNFNSPEDLSQH